MSENQSLKSNEESLHNAFSYDRMNILDSIRDTLSYEANKIINEQDLLLKELFIYLSNIDMLDKTVWKKCSQNPNYISFYNNMKIKEAAVDVFSKTYLKKHFEADSKCINKRFNKILIDAEHESNVIKRFNELKSQGLWLNNLFPLYNNPDIPMLPAVYEHKEKYHMDYLHEEIMWLSTDFQLEKKWKVSVAYKLAKACQKYVEDLVNAKISLHKEKEDSLKRIAYKITNCIMNFWSSINKMVIHKKIAMIEIKKRQEIGDHLDSLLNESEKYSTQIAQSINDLNEDDDEYMIDTVSSDESINQESDNDQNEIDDLINQQEISMEELIESLPKDYINNYKDVNIKKKKSSDNSDVDIETYYDEIKSNVSTSKKVHTFSNSKSLFENSKCLEEAISADKGKIKVSFLIKHTLRPYQIQGVEWLVSLYKNNLNGILADEMGLGKTIQTIALLAYLASNFGVWGPHLIIVPTSVILNWEYEFKKWCPALKVMSYYGTQKERKNKRQGWSKENSFHVCITSYRLVVIDHLMFRRKQWKYMILDEAQNIKNFKCQRWKSLLNLNTENRLLLTGTPLQNHLMELWSLMHFLMPDLFSSHNEFKQWFSNPLSKLSEQLNDKNIKIVKKLHKVLRPFILRRLKKDVEKQLPNKNEYLVKCRLSKRQKYLYDDYMAMSTTQNVLKEGNLMSVISVLIQLRKVCNHPDLFEARPVQSPLLLEKLNYFLPSIVTNLIDPFQNYSFQIIENFSMDSFHNISDIISIESLIDYWISMLNSPNILSLIMELVNESKCSKRLLMENYFINVFDGQNTEDCILLRILQTTVNLILFNLKLTIFKSLSYSQSKFSLNFIQNTFKKSLKKSTKDLTIFNLKDSFDLKFFERYLYYVPTVIVETPYYNGVNSHFGILNKLNIVNDFLYKKINLDPLIKPIETRRRLVFPETRLIQYDCGKLQVLDDLLCKFKKNGHRVLIFTQMTKMLDILECFLSFHGYSYLRLDGCTKVELRQILMDRFNFDEKIFCFILSTRSGGIGLNLTGADTVIFYDSDWNPTIDAQAQDRCHRIGQTRQVNIYRLVCEGTIEENIIQRAKEKQLLGSLAIDGGNFNTLNLKNNSLRDLFKNNSSQSFSDLTNVSVTSFNLPINNALKDSKLEDVLMKVEDEEDIVAAKNLKNETNKLLKDFNEEVNDGDIDDNEKTMEVDNDKVIFFDNDFEKLFEKLKSIEKYAFNFLENDNKQFISITQIKNNERHKREWEASFFHDQNKKLKTEENNSKQLYDFTYSVKNCQTNIFLALTQFNIPILLPPTLPKVWDNSSNQYSNPFSIEMYENEPIQEDDLPSLNYQSNYGWDFYTNKNDFNRPHYLLLNKKRLLNNNGVSIFVCRTKKPKKDSKLKRKPSNISCNNENTIIKKKSNSNKSKASPLGLLKICFSLLDDDIIKKFVKLSRFYRIEDSKTIVCKLSLESVNWSMVANLISLSNLHNPSAQSCYDRYNSLMSIIEDTYNKGNNNQLNSSNKKNKRKLSNNQINHTKKHCKMACSLVNFIAISKKVLKKPSTFEYVSSSQSTRKSQCKMTGKDLLNVSPLNIVISLAKKSQIESNNNTNITLHPTQSIPVNTALSQSSISKVHNQSNQSTASYRNQTTKIISNLNSLNNNFNNNNINRLRSLNMATNLQNTAIRMQNPNMNTNFNQRQLQPNKINSNNNTRLVGNIRTNQVTSNVCIPVQSTNSSSVAGFSSNQPLIILQRPINSLSNNNRNATTGNIQNRNQMHLVTHQNSKTNHQSTNSSQSTNNPPIINNNLMRTVMSNANNSQVTSNQANHQTSNTITVGGQTFQITSINQNTSPLNIITNQQVLRGALNAISNGQQISTIMLQPQNSNNIPNNQTANLIIQQTNNNLNTSKTPTPVVVQLQRHQSSNNQSESNKTGFSPTTTNKSSEDSTQIVNELVNIEHIEKKQDSNGFVL